MHAIIPCSRLSLLVPIYVAFFLLSRASSLGDDHRNDADLQALLKFKAKITSDPLKLLSSWNDTVDFCQWHGVTCSGRSHRRVTKLEINSSKLAGSISPHVGNLSFLRVLNLANNQFSSKIPQEIEHLGRLEQLQLANNSIVGQVPSNISGCSKLIFIDLAGNMLSGEIPVALGGLPYLQHLRFSANNLIGKIPPSLGNLSSLEMLYLDNNAINGLIPESLGQLSNLTCFSLRQNRFSGVIPSSIFNLSNIKILDVTLNQVEGVLPVEMGTTMPCLEELYIFDNQFTGRIPPSLSNATHLLKFEAGKNNFTGHLPSLKKLDKLISFLVDANHLGSEAAGDLNFVCSLVNATGLKYLVLGRNKFGGVIPECIGHLSTHLIVFAMEDNKLIGKIPKAIGNLINLEWLSLEKNRLSGSIPSVIGSFAWLQLLSLEENRLSGNIPSSLGDLKVLLRLYMNNNYLEGSIPPSLGMCQGLIELDLSENKLSGLIPAQILNLSSLSISLGLSGNHLTGSIPSEVGKLNHLGVLNVSGNLLSGQIPSSIGSCESLEILDVSGNQFRGAIPSSLSLLRGIQMLNLSSNQFTGKIPSFLVDLRLLKSLDLSHNDFEGTVPSEGVFLNGSAISVEGNNKLCGGIAAFKLSNCNFHVTKGNKTLSSWKRIALIFFALLGAAFLVSTVLVLWLLRKKKESISSKFEHQFIELSYHSLSKVTDGFSSATLIGVGSFGSVYKGILEDGRKPVAIKVLNLLQHQAAKSFLAECEALRNVRHRNIVKILTVCSSVDQQGNNFKALVYELMSNGSLEEWLHPKTELSDLSHKPRVLNLLQRLNIAIDIACALDYLHHQCETQIIHCDLKPSNVLLDDDMTAHLSDFGLVRFLPRIADTGSVDIRGSIGYIAPEYEMGSKVSTYGDVYSYGVLLLEMFTGKSPTDEVFQDGLNLHKFVKVALLENMWEILDSTILRENQEPGGISIYDLNRSSRQFLKIQECLITIIRIGVVCSAEISRERMSISDVVVKLSLVKERLVENRTHRIR